MKNPNECDVFGGYSNNCGCAGCACFDAWNEGRASVADDLTEELKWAIGEALAKGAIERVVRQLRGEPGLPGLPPQEPSTKDPV